MAIIKVLAAMDLILPMNIEMVINTSLVVTAERDFNYQDNKECVTIRLADNTRMCLDITWDDYQKHVFGHRSSEIVQAVGGRPYTWEGLGAGQDPVNKGPLVMIKEYVGHIDVIKDGMVYATLEADSDWAVFEVMKPVAEFTEISPRAGMYFNCSTTIEVDGGVSVRIYPREPKPLTDEQKAEIQKILTDAFGTEGES